MSKVTPIIYTGSLFKRLREEQGVSVYSLWKQTNVSEQTITAFEKEEKTIYLTTLTKLLNALYGLKTNGNDNR